MLRAVQPSDLALLHFPHRHFVGSRCAEWGYGTRRHPALPRGARRRARADVITELGIVAPEPFVVWCGLLARRVWMSATRDTAQMERSKNRLVGPTTWEAALAVGREGVQDDRDGMYAQGLYRYRP